MTTRSSGTSFSTITLFLLTRDRRHFGPDAHELAKDKKITLIEGPELLHLFEKHGYTFRIDIKEARKLLGLTRPTPKPSQHEHAGEAAHLITILAQSPRFEGSRGCIQVEHQRHDGYRREMLAALAMDHSHGAAPEVGGGELSRAARRTS